MSIVIHVHDDLARRLQSEAENHNLPVEDLAVRILDSAVSQSSSGADWGRRNRRRLELIRKSTRHELTEREQAELDELQSSLDQRFESFDAGLLAELDEMKATVARLAAESLMAERFAASTASVASDGARISMRFAAALSRSCAHSTS